MRLPRVTIRRWVVEVWLVVVLILLAIWIVRPGSAVEWLGLDGLGQNSARSPSSDNGAPAVSPH